MPEIAFTLDDVPVTVDVDPKTSTLDVLRDRLGVYACKSGCSPQGLCGCCTALVDGRPRLTCTLPVKSVAGKALGTLASIPSAERARLAAAFDAAGASQCGYCTPGFVLSTFALLAAKPDPSDDDVGRALNPHTCRCTGYAAILRAVRQLARGEPAGPGRRPEGPQIALGERPFVDDLAPEGLLHGVPVLARSHGVLESVTGGVAVAVPGTRVYPGSVVAGAWGATPAEARASAAEIVVTVREEAPPTGVHAKGRRAEGSVDRALDGCPHVAKGTFQFAATDPVFLEPEAALAVPGAGGVVVYSAAEDAAAVAGACGAEVVLVPSGGSYGGKAGPLLEPCAAALCRAADAPVRVGVSLEEGMALHPRRPGGTVRAMVGADREGRIVAVKARVVLDGGAACVGAERIVGRVLGGVPYACGNVALDAQIDRTASHPTAAVRGAGLVALTVALEALMDQLAVALALDGAELRRRNLPEEGRAVLGDAVGPVAVARAPGEGTARVVLTVAGPDEVEVQCSVPDLGQGRDQVLVEVLAATTGLDPGVFTVAWGRSGVVGSAAPPGAPVAEAARAAGEALRAHGGALGSMIGASFVGEGPPAGQAWAAVRARLDEGGRLAGIEARAACGAVQDAVAVAGLAEGTAHMGLGVALSEEVPAGEGRFRMLGVVKPRACPPLVGVPVVLGQGERDGAEVGVAAAAAAVAGAVGAARGALATPLPVKDSAAAAGVGVRPAGGRRPETGGESQEEGRRS
jgi:xanthine dehydrogenase molybdenum-binding subunit